MFHLFQNSDLIQKEKIPCDFIDIHSVINNIHRTVLDGIKTAHRVSDPVIRYVNGEYYIAVWVLFYNGYDYKVGTVGRPSMWAIYDIKTGNKIATYEKNNDFSDAPYEKIYNLASENNLKIIVKNPEKIISSFDEVRLELIQSNKFNKEKYEKYLNAVIASAPKDFRRFYKDLSV